VGHGCRVPGNPEDGTRPKRGLTGKKKTKKNNRNAQLKQKTKTNGEKREHIGLVSV
jgi:hypothetical protein